MPDLSKKKRAIASRLITARKQSGLSQFQVATMMKLHRPSVSEFEAGRRGVSAQELAKLADIYGVSVSWLACTETDSPDPIDDRLQLAARGLSKLNKADFERVLELLSAIGGTKGSE